MSAPPPEPEQAQLGERALGKPRARLMAMADRALEDRPVFSIRMQVYLSVAILFVIVVAMALTTTATTSRVERAVHLFQVASRFLFELDQARRFEKNAFLDGTSLDAALEHTHAASRILRQNAAGLDAAVGQESRLQMVELVQRYERALQTQTTAGNQRGTRDRQQAEAEVRRRGRNMVSYALSLEEREKRDLNRQLSLARQVQHVLIVFLLLYIVLMTYMLVRRIVSPIRRFMEYIRRIGAGDPSPIMPRRRYRDEFSELAVAINDMLEELDRRQGILVQSHKLRAVGTLVAGVAHELNNPINNITLTAYMLLEDYAELSDAERQEMIQDVIGESARTKKIVSSLLDFARQSESKVEPLDLGEVVKATAALTQNQLNLKGVRLDLKIKAHLPKIYGDVQQLTQVIMNLILNALDVTEKGGRIELAVDLAVGSGFLEVKVRDYGPGIPDHIIPHIFDPFFTTKVKGKGTGLGLSISQGIVRKHGGDLNVHTVMGQGTTFLISLPVSNLPMDFATMRADGEAQPG